MTQGKVRDLNKLCVLLKKSDLYFEAIFETNNIETITADKTTVAKASCFSTSKNLDHSFLEKKKTNCAMRK